MFKYVLQVSSFFCVCTHSHSHRLHFIEMRTDFLGAVHNRYNERTEHVYAVGEFAVMLIDPMRPQRVQTSTIAPSAHEHHRSDVQTEHELANRQDNRTVQRRNVSIICEQYADDEDYSS